MTTQTKQDKHLAYELAANDHAALTAYLKQRARTLVAEMEADYGRSLADRAEHPFSMAEWAGSACAILREFAKDPDA